MSDYTQTFSFAKSDGIDIVEVQEMEDIETEFALVETAVNSKADVAGDTISMADLTVTADATFAGATVADLGTVTTANIDGGTLAGVTVDGSLTWSAAQNFGGQNLTNVDVDSGSLDGATVGAASASTGVFTQLDWTRSAWTRIASADSPYSASVGERIFCDCDGAIEIDLPASPATNDTIWVRVDKDADTNSVTLDPGTGDSIAGQAANATLVIDRAYATLELVANASDNWDI